MKRVYFGKVHGQVFKIDDDKSETDWAQFQRDNPHMIMVEAPIADLEPDDVDIDGVDVVVVSPAVKARRCEKRRIRRQQIKRQPLVLAAVDALLSGDQAAINAIRLEWAKDASDGDYPDIDECMEVKTNNPITS